MIEIKKYNYYLLSKLIAKIPANPRDHSRLLVFSDKKINHDHFYNLRKYLKTGDLLVINDSRVMPARLFGQKSSGGKIEVLILEKSDKYWRAMIGGKVSTGDKIFFADDLSCKIFKKQGKEAKIGFNKSGRKLWQKIEKIGNTPIPPYVKDAPLSENRLRKEYQTVYARDFGSAAAPTAGLHFTKKLIGELQSVRINFAPIDLHIGLGTFAPLSDENLKNNKLHSEKFSIPRSTIKKIIETKKTGGRIIAVGTTSVRALESSSLKILSNEKNVSDKTDIFIQPGYKFQIVDGLITNFHLPRSSLMILVAAFLQHKGEKNGREKLLELYKIAIKKKYRFYSFGDAMLII